MLEIKKKKADTACNNQNNIQIKYNKMKSQIKIVMIEYI